MNANRRSAAGLTLVELLVVIVVLATITIAVIPAITPSQEARQLREAARGLNAFLSGARARAISTGRPVGVQIRRLENQSLAAMDLVYVQMPETYAGDAMGATCRLRITQSPSTANAPFLVTANNFTSWINQSVVHPGDLVRFGYKGYYYEILTRNNSDMQLRVYTNGAPLPWPTGGSGSNPVTFQVFRQPVFITNPNSANPNTGSVGASADVFQMPGSTVIDLGGSALPGVPLQANDTQPITIMFSPSGGLAGIYSVGSASASGGQVRFPAAGLVHLLVGQREKVPGVGAGGTADDTNWLDSHAMWVSISNLTGQVSTAEMNANVNLWTASQFARDAYGLGGK